MSERELHIAFFNFKDAMYKHFDWVNPTFNSRGELEDQGRIIITVRQIDSLKSIQTLEAIVLKQNKKRQP